MPPTSRACLRALAPAFAAVLSAGCQAGYLLGQARGQARVLWGREPVEAVLGRPDLDAETRRKLALVREARRFAAEAIGLDVQDNYTTYYDVGGPAVAYALTAAPKDALEPVTWWFPIVGRVPYLGFFEKADGEARRDALLAEGYDVVLRGVPAFSTLGWFADPVFSTMLAMEDARLVSTVIHELTHATLFIPGAVEFNENLATFVGERGATLFFEQADGADSPRARAVGESFEDARRFGAFLAEMMEGLRAYYARPVARNDKIEGREKEFERWQNRYRSEVVPALHGAAYRWFPEARLDNALLLSLGAYHGGLDLFQRASEACGGNLARLMKKLRFLEEDRGDPAAALASRLKDDPAFCR